MSATRTSSREHPGAPREILCRFVALAAAAGLLLGIFEAALLRSSPRVQALLLPDVSWVEWFLAPLVDMACFALGGAFLGWLAARRPGKHRIALLAAVELAAVVMFVALRFRWLHSRTVMGEFAWREDILIPLAWLGAGFAGALPIVYLLGKPAANLLPRIRWRVLTWTLAIAALAATLGTAVFWFRPFSRPPQLAAAEAPAAARQPNIVLIVLDTVRADHLSAYGYARPTTPNLDRLARQGVLFENAIAPSSWTLASHASMFTGLLPHQHGADWASPLPGGPWTLADVLAARGYQTAGFAGNFDYCQTGWGVARGFQTYIDDSHSFSHNLASTLAGTALIQPAYQRFCRFDYLERQSARQVNQNVFRWFGQRSPRPFFLFVNYFDCHVPYLTPAPYGQRFGRVSSRVVHKLFAALQSKNPPAKFTPAEQAELIAGYDNSLAYLDQQVGALLEALQKSPAGQNTIVIVTSDHGEAFGEQGWYSHGYNLYREVVHVPLILAGPGIPKGVRLGHLARTSDLFSTVLDLAAGGKNPFSSESLARLWNPAYQPRPFDDFAVSELVPVFNDGGRQAMISLTTSQWQYIYDSSGRQELYHWTSDPLEQKNVADAPGRQAQTAGLHEELVDLLAKSSQPWRDTDYLFAHSRGNPFLNEILAAQKPLARPALRARQRGYIGQSQALFKPQRPSPPMRLGEQDSDLLNSLPYQ